MNCKVTLAWYEEVIVPFVPHVPYIAQVLLPTVICLSVQHLYIDLDVGVVSVYQEENGPSSESEEQLVLSQLNKSVLEEKRTRLPPLSCRLTYSPSVRVGPAAMRPTCALELVS